MGDTRTIAELPTVEIGARTDPGRDPTKTVNEDSCGHRATRFGYLAVVCDGMGGHFGGQEASQVALSAIFETFDTAPPNARGRDVLVRAIEHANARVFALAPHAGHARPGSTVVAALLHSEGCDVAHVGDSRCYFVHAGQADQLTRDHSVVQQMVAAGLLTEEAAKAHPDANRITRALGTDTEVDVELAPRPFPFVAGDVFILCSDGLSDLVEPRDILSIAGSEPPTQAAGRLVDLANARGGHDNVTVLVVRVRTSAGSPTSGVAPTVVQTYVPEIASAPDVSTPVLVPTAPARSRRAPNKLIVVVGITLAAIGVAALLVVLVVSLRPEHHHSSAIEIGPQEAAGLESTAQPPALEPTDLPKLHQPDGSLRP